MAIKKLRKLNITFDVSNINMFNRCPKVELIAEYEGINERQGATIEIDVKTLDERSVLTGMPLQLLFDKIQPVLIELDEMEIP